MNIEVVNEYLTTFIGKASTLVPQEALLFAAILTLELTQ